MKVLLSLHRLPLSTQTATVIKPRHAKKLSTSYRSPRSTAGWTLSSKHPLKRHGLPVFSQPLLQDISARHARLDLLKGSARQQSTLHQVIGSYASCEPGDDQDIHSSSMNALEEPSTAVLAEGVEAVTLPMFDATKLTYYPIDMVIGAVNQLHESSGLPWWASIMSFAFVFRVTCMPFIVKTKQNAARLNYAKEDMEKAQNYGKKIQDKGNAATKEEREEVTEIMKTVFKKHQCNPLTSIGLMLVQIPIYSMCFFAIRRLCTNYQDLTVGGPGMLHPSDETTLSLSSLINIVDLSVPDSTYILGPVTSLILLATVRMGIRDAQAQAKARAKEGEEQPNKMQKVMTVVGYAMSTVIIPVSLYIPSGVMMYIMSTSMTALGINIALKFPGIDKQLGFHPDFVPGKLADLAGESNSSRILSSEKPTLGDSKPSRRQKRQTNL